MTEGRFKYIDPATFGGAQGKPWGKVDVDYTSFSRTDTPAEVHNIRGREAEFSSVDTAGFAVYQYPAQEKLFTDDRAVREGYYSEVEQLLRTKLAEGNKVKKIVIFDHTIRRRQKGSARAPVQQVHVDQTPGAAEARVRRHVPDPEEVDKLLKGRYQLINVWRPIENKASDFPLAVIDWRTTSPEDLIKVDLMYPIRDQQPDPVRKGGEKATKAADSGYDEDDDRGKERLPEEDRIASLEGYHVKGETYAVAPNDKHKFYYYKDMTPEEVMFIKCFDSRSEGQPGGTKGVAALTPHTAFEDPETPKDAPARQSIEVRCLIFYED